MTDEQRLQMITEQLILVRDNLFRGMSKSIQKLQARSINELLELPSHTQSPPTLSLAQRKPLKDEEILTYRHMIDWTAEWSYINFARAIEQAHGITGEQK